MPTQPKRFYAKLLLFGEYTVVKGGNALACPIRNYAGQWIWSGQDASKQYELPEFLNYLQTASLHQPLDVEKLASALADGAYFKSNIPTGYGVGSSGALCAAIYATFGKTNDATDLRVQQEDLALMEQFFHGKSSGTDPLISLLDQAILIDPVAGIQPRRIPSLLPPYHFFLIDTHQSRKTGPLVQQFLAACEQPAYTERLQQELIPITQFAIDACLSEKWNDLFTYVKAISILQFQQFQAMIPDAFKTLWEESLTADFFSLKLCGAGGGGFILGLTRDLERLKAQLAHYTIVIPQF